MRSTCRLSSYLAPLILGSAIHAGVGVYGAGCPAGNGWTPSLTVDGAPLAGGTFELEIATQDPGALVLLVAGFSSETWGPVPLPLDLETLGYPGCSLHLALEFWEGLTPDATGTAHAAFDGLPAGASLFLQAFVASSGGGAGTSSALAIEVDAPLDPFTVVMLPDTQHYSDDATNAATFAAQTQWIAGHQTHENIRFVTLVGDIVQHGGWGPDGNVAEWQRADDAMSTLDGNLAVQPDGLLPYAAVAGNHDFDLFADKSSAARYRQYFGPDRYAGRAWYQGASPSEVNMAQTFTAGGRTFLNLGLEWHPSDEAILWAQSVLAAHPTLPTIVSTHEHLTVGVPAGYSLAGEALAGAGDNGGLSVFGKLIEPFPQVFLVLCGHAHGDGHLTATTGFGATVHQVVADYQEDPGGGNGWMQLLRFRPDVAEIEFQTFSPVYVAGVTPGPDRSLSTLSNFTLEFDTLEHRAQLETTTTRRFRQGQDFGFGTYGAARDTYVGNGTVGATQESAAYGQFVDLRVDGDGDQEQSLLAFDGIFGDGPGQIPPGTQVKRALLTVTSEGAGAESVDGARLHRMLTPWSEQSTWNSLGAGIQLGSEALAHADVQVSGLVDTVGTRSFDVTDSVRAWAHGAQNHGWVILSDGTDRWQFRSTEWPQAIVERPMLTVQW